MQLDILTPEKRIFSGEADAVSFPGTAGAFQVLNHHAPLISSLKEGKVKVRTKKEEKLFTIKSGFVEVLKNKVTVLVEGVEEVS
ncbi:MAG: ATP synthase F1 subunit epsilon [Chitinophagales bacterium]|nr:ATP synthase F1 subunit epsilon [Chitinophagaceae bacterium]MBP9883832.1 ATP synthase F1 subunit epsilon [Chitinophagales bacterium]